jgi:hypothetical protein
MCTMLPWPLLLLLLLLQADYMDSCTPPAPQD